MRNPFASRFVHFACTAATITALVVTAAGVEGAPPASQPALPGDAMIAAYLARVTAEIDNAFPGDVQSAEEWSRKRPEYLREYDYMLGLDPMPERTPLQATVTGTIEGDGFVVDKLHYQSRPRLYVTANLYRPASPRPGERMPAILYVCGHANMGRNGNKTHYQAWGPWFARHGYVCLMVDTLQLGEIAGIHHGTYREGRWWWISRGYTPAGVECWNGIRGIDYLISRPDVDPERIAVTGISGGGASTWWIAAADDRVRVAVPVSGMSDLTDYVTGHIVDGHCDCMFVHNTFAWPWTRLAGLVAPRPLFFVNSDNDTIFPMSGNERISNRMERFYSLFGAGERFETLVSVGGHAYRQDIRRAVYRFINTWLKNDPRPVEDSEMDLVVGEGRERKSPIEPERLRVFPRDEDIPADQLNTTIDQYFVPVAKVEPPAAGEFEARKRELMNKLRQVSFRWFPDRVEAAKVDPLSAHGTGLAVTEAGIQIDFRIPLESRLAPPRRSLLVLNGSASLEAIPDWLVPFRESGDVACLVNTRGEGERRWTTTSPPNRVARSHLLLGRTVDAGRVWDAISLARHLHGPSGGDLPVCVAGRGAQAVIAVYAALLEPDIAGVIMVNPPESHMDRDAPPILNVLRVCDIPEIVGMIAPRPLTLIGASDQMNTTVRAWFQAANAADKLTIKPR